MGLDVLYCPTCHGRMELIAAIEDPAVVARILSHLGLRARPPPRGRPFCPPRQLALERLDDRHQGVDAPSAFE